MPASSITRGKPTCCRNTSVLLRKNWLLKKSDVLGSVLEVALPLAFIIGMLFLKGLFHTDTVAAVSYESDPANAAFIPSFFSLPLGLKASASGAILAVTSLSASGQAAAARFHASSRQLYPGTNLSTLGGGALLDALGSSPQAAAGRALLGSLTLPGYSDIAVLFDSEAALTSYVQASDYGSTGKPPVYAAIVFSRDLPSLDYTLRFNDSVLPNVYPFVFTYSPSFRGGTKYLTFEPPQPGQYGAASATSALLPSQPPGAPALPLRLPALLTLQLMVDRFAINQSAGLPSTVLQPLALATSFCQGALPSAAAASSALAEALGAACAGLSSNATLAAAVGADLAAHAFAAEAMAPQRVDLVPFPTRQYTQNVFYSGVLGALTLLFVLAYIYPVSRLISALVYEKETKMRESMLIMGLSDGALYGSWFVSYALTYLLLCVLITLVGLRLFPASSPLIVFLLFFSFSLSTITLCMLISVFFTQSKVGSVLGSTVFLGAYFVFFSIKSTTPLNARLLAALLSPTSLGMGLQTLAALETNGVGATVATASTLAVDSWTVGSSISLQLWDTVLYLLLAYYAEKVLPTWLRDFGTPLPFYFPCMPSFWGCRRCSSRGCSSSSSSGSGSGSAGLAAPLLSQGEPSAQAGSMSSKASRGANPVHFEPQSSSMAAKEEAGKCVSLRGLTKHFDTPDGLKVAVAGIDMQMYEGEIFVLLGHNGAGKTTTISMLTGLIPPTAGSARVFGVELGEDLSAIRSDLGVCPQHDILWPQLTVLQHLEIFAAIKGVPPEQVSAAASEALVQVGLTEKAGAAAGSMSGGQKRKLSVCIAFLGGSKVVLLDEPTSGMDPYSRRSTWQILQNAREGRVILLTTHFMDEADILADRISVMAAGSVQCSGSPQFLKDAYGLGYTLTIVCSAALPAPAAAVAPLLALVQRHVPAAALISQAGGEVKFRLPTSSTSASASAAFPALLRELEGRTELVGSLGIHLTSIEDVFMKIATEGHGPASLLEEGGKEGKGGLQGGEAAFAATGGAATDSTHLVADKSTYGTEAGAGAGAGSSSSSSSLQSVREAARAELSPWDAFFIHLGAIFLKRARYSRRDWRAVCCLLLVPVVALTAGLSLILSGSIADTVDFQLSTAQFNSGNFFAAQGSAPTLMPAFAFYPTAFNASSGAGAPPPLPPDAAPIQAFLDSFPTANVSLDSGALLVHGAAAAALDASNHWGFVQAATAPLPPLHDLQRLSTFLLDNSGAYRDSKFGALLVTGGLRSALAPGSAPGSNLTLAILYNSTAVNAAPIFLNLADTAALRAALGWAPGAPGTPPSISTHIHALPYTSWELGNRLIGQSFGVIQVLLLSLSFVTPSFIQFVVRETEMKAKHQQLISGVSIPAYWVANLAWDVLTYCLPALLCLVCLRAFNASYFITAAAGKLPAVLLLLLTYGLSGAAFTYAASHLFASPGSASAAAVMFNILQFAATTALTVLGFFPSTCQAVPLSQSLLNLLPYFALGTGLSRVAALETLGGPFGTAGACDKQNGILKPDSAYPLVTSALDLQAAGGPILYLALTFPLYLGAAVLIDYARADMAFRSRVEAALGAAGQGLRRALGGGGGAEQQPLLLAAGEEEERVDPDVAAEAARAERAVETATTTAGTATGDLESTGAAAPPPPPQDVILLSRLRKHFGAKRAVRDISFGVPSGEVFGFLGINGAGKTTTLRMLTGDELPGGGRALLAGYDIIAEQGAVRRLLGYCPQFDALLDLLTVREHLELYARIKGVPVGALAGVVRDKVAEFDLGDFENKLAGKLSGGNKRKLSVAIALIGGPPVVFLDEPSTGVDPVAKRLMWKVISRITTERRHCSIILTTHSMEEVEALCSRIGIMVGGRLRCLGSAQHLRNTHGAGFTLDIRLPSPSPAALSAIAARASATGLFDAAGWLPGRAALGQLASALGHGEWEGEVRDEGRGWQLAGAFSARGGCSLSEFSQWWGAMEAGSSAEAYVTGTAFPGAALSERQGECLKFSIPQQDPPLALSALFQAVEAARGQLGQGCSVALGQTSLEAVFNSFAGQGNPEEGGGGRGMVGRQAGGGSSAAAGGLAGAVARGVARAVIGH